MLQMAAVFAELERGTIRERVMAGLARVRAEGKKTLDRPKVAGRWRTPYALAYRPVTAC
jgi:DNA invertase Pin-like site-specific DNA recombinase